MQEKKGPDKIQDEPARIKTTTYEYLTSLVPADVGDKNLYILRNANNIQLIRSRTAYTITRCLSS